nr:InlB B-repeat-containing protein [Bacteroidales bacterium]
MKHILRYTVALFCVVLALTACLPEEPVHETINMGAGELTNLSSSAASLMCEIEDELPKYSKIEYGIVYSDNREKVENHKGVKKIEGQGISENRFTVQLADLKAKQEYFYCSYLRIDEGRMIYGDISSFVTKASYKATFDANGGKGGMEPQHFEEDDNKALTENTFTREHHEFAGWNTKSDGSGSYYQPGSLYTLSEDVKLFAQWQAYSGMEEGYTYVDLGLSVEWATRNVGAERREAYGDYFAWGETQPKSNYAWETYQWGIASDLLTKYCIDAAHGKNGATDGKTVLELSDDAARVQWKGDWRMPTLAEQQELREKCTWQWKNLNGIAGYEVTGPSGKSIFLPAAGFKNNDALHQAGSYGCYWSSNLYEIQSDYAYYLNIIPSTHEQAQYSRSYGYSLRPVYTTYYCLRFDANGGTGKMDSMMVKKTETATLPANTFTRDGYIFTTWNTAADGSGTKVAVQSKFSPTSDTTFYAQWRKLHTVSFDANGGEGTMEPQIFEHGIEQHLKANTFTREGYVFMGWNTKADGSGTSYSDQQKISIEADVTLYAQWEIIKYKLSFNANGGTGTMSDQIFEYGAANTINANLFIREGFIFTGWNTQANASGTAYTDKQSITLTENTTLYAQWKRKTYTLTFDANGGTGTMPSQIFQHGIPKSLPNNTFTREEYGFVGWNTKADGSGTDYTDKQSISLTNDITLYAQWIELSPIYISYESNGGSGEMTLQESNSFLPTIIWDCEYSAPRNATFLYWNTKEDGSGTIYRPNQKVVLEDDLTLYAQWKYSAYQIVYMPNGGTGTMSEQIVAAGITKNLSKNTFYRDGYAFAGWNTEADGSGVSYRDAQSIKLTNNITLYAQWNKLIYVTFDANGGTGTMSAQTFEPGIVQELKTNILRRLNYYFAGWNTEADGSGDSYADAQYIILTEDIKLYAQWKELSVSGSVNGYNYVDLGLPSGLKWATWNVGATSPEGYGSYFAWGETSSKSKYTWGLYKYCTSGGDYYIISGGWASDEVVLSKYTINDLRNSLEFADDAARFNWGGGWRMPTKAEQEELINNCTRSRITLNGVKGFLLSSNINGNSIFIPAAGYKRIRIAPEELELNSTVLSEAGSVGAYWSSSLDVSNPISACHMTFISNSGYSSTTSRNWGLPIRAVCP